MSIICMVRVGRVEEREFWILTLVLANLIFELRRIGGTSDEGSGSVNNGYRVLDHLLGIERNNKIDMLTFDFRGR